MNCNCIETVNDKIRKAVGDPEAELDVMFTLGKGIDTRLFIPYTFREKKKDGSFTKEKQGKLALHKCPFCGKEQE